MGEVHRQRVTAERLAEAARRRRLFRLAVALVVTLVVATGLTAWATQSTPLLRVPVVAGLVCGEGRTPTFVGTLTLTQNSPAPVRGKRIACLDAAGEEPDGPNNLAMLKLWALAALALGAPLVWWARR